MLEIINNLAPFFEDCYRRISVREYAKIIDISPPTASKILMEYNKEGLLKKQEDRNYLFFFADKESRTFIELSRIYWGNKLREVTEYIEKIAVNPAIILFGSLSKAETTPNSDIDLAIIAHKKELDIKDFEKKLKREFQVFWFDSFNRISEELKDNILNGYVLSGKVES
jgi:predicted nucleotidyltransferase